jgi:hypothetical protein
VYQLFVNFIEACDPIRREKFYNIIFERGITVKLVRTIEVCLNEISYIILIHKHVSDKFLIQDGLK